MACASAAGGVFFLFRVDFGGRRSTRVCRDTVSTIRQCHLPEGETVMVQRFLACGLLMILALTLSLASHGGEKTSPKPPTPPMNAALEKMKKLAGTWLLADKDGKPTDQIASIIKVTAGGSAVHETLFPGQPHEMISVYMIDGPDVIMTHYCVLGNQPRMK